MRRPAAPHRLPAALVAGLLALLAGAVWFAPPALAEDAVIEVAHSQDGSLHPADVTVHPGDTVTWRWTANEHHRITFDDGLPESATTSGSPECQSGPPPLGHGDCTGHEYAVTFEDTGTHAYRDTQGLDAEGTVTVAPAPTPSTEEPAASDSPSPEPGGSDPDDSSSSPDASTERSDAPDEDDTQEPSQDRQAPAESVLSGGAEGTSDAQSPEVATASPSDEPSEVEDSPDDEPTFEDFPEPSDPTPATEDVPGEVAVGGDDGGGTARVVWGALGGATVLGTLGAFVRVVVLDDSWSPA